MVAEVVVDGAKWHQFRCLDYHCYRIDMIQSKDVVLFQGDSITDCQRNRSQEAQANAPEALGLGYARYAGAMILDRWPGVAIYNRGIGGDKVWQLEQRWQVDCLDLVPDVLSVLIGINDTYHALDGGAATSLQHYDQVYRQLLKQAQEANPSIRLVLCEPFALRCGQVTECWFPELDRRRDLVKEIAMDFGAVLVLFQESFDQALDRAEAAYWAEDGVHPSLAGHMLMARVWMETVGRD